MNIQITDLDFGYNKERILRQINLNIRCGEYVSIIGPNGTGKTTLIKCINGLLQPDKGQVAIDGNSVQQMSRSKIARHIGYIPQSSSGLFPLSVFDMVLLGRRPHLAWRSARGDKLNVLNALRLLKIQHLAMKNYNELSGGQQQKVIIARAIAQETNILLLDEATSNLDIKHQFEVMAMIRSLVDQKKRTAVMIAHDLNLAARFSDRIVMMADKTIVASGKPAEILTVQNIAKVFGIGVDIHTTKGRPFIIPLGVTDAEEAGFPCHN